MAVVNVLGGGAASAQPSDEVINACVNDTNGNVRIVDDASQCRQHEHSTAWNSTGSSTASCVSVTGPCGNGMYNQPTSYFDRVRGYCPGEQPFLGGADHAATREPEAAPNDPDLRVEVTHPGLTSLRSSAAWRVLSRAS